MTAAQRVIPSGVRNSEQPELRKHLLAADPHPQYLTESAAADEYATKDELDGIVQQVESGTVSTEDFNAMQAELDDVESGLVTHISDTSNVHGIQNPADLVKGGLSLSTGKALKSDGAGKIAETTSLPLTDITFTDNGGSTQPRQLRWNEDEQCLQYGTTYGTTNQIGQETWVKAHNDTGVVIPNGKAVYVTGAYAPDRCVTVALSSAAAATGSNARLVLGITTQDIADGECGFVTTHGLVRELDTSSYTGGANLWLSETPGELTETKPDIPSVQVRVAICAVSDATEGVLDVLQIDAGYQGAFASAYENIERTGFVLRNGVAVDVNNVPLTISVDDGTRTLTLGFTDAFRFFQYDNERVISTAQTVEWTDVEGLHYFYYDTDQVLQHTTTFSPAFILGPDAFVAYIYWDATNGVVILGNAQIEFHGAAMPGATHYHFHQTLGSQTYDGLALSGFVTGNGSLDSHAQFGVESGLIADEDLWHATAAVLSTTGLPILYLDGAGANVRQMTKAGFAVLTDNDTGAGTTGRLVWNEYTGGAWKTTTVSVNDFVLYHVFAVGTASGGSRVYAVMGQAEYGNAGSAREGALNEMGTLAQLLPFAEIRPIGSIIFQTGNYANAVQAKTVLTDLGDFYVDFRFDAVPGGTGFTASDHNALSGRSVAGSHPATAISYTGATSGLAATDVQGAIDELDGDLDGHIGTSASVHGITDTANLVYVGDDAADLGSATATDGYVLTADGAGGAAWEVPTVPSHAHDWSHITTGKPTTIAGYGITDAYTESEVDTLLTGYSLTGHTHASYLTDAPSDGSTYGRKDGAWAVATGGTGGGIEEAPIDGYAYARKDAAWLRVEVQVINLLELMTGDFLQLISGRPLRLMEEG